MNRRYIIPLAVFIIFWLTGFIVSADHLAYQRTAIQRMVVGAAERSEPIIAATSTRSFGAKLSRWYLCSFEDEPIALDMNLGPNSGHAMFSDDGVLYISVYSRGTARDPDIARIVLPGYRADPVHDMIIGNGFMGSQWVVPASRLQGGGDGSDASGERPPWEDPERRSGRPISSHQSPDGAITVWLTQGMDSGDPQALWRHDNRDGSWTQISDEMHILSTGWPIYVGPDASLIGFRDNIPTSQGSSIGMVFIDGHTGDVIRSEPNMLDVVIGRRWVASSYTPIVPFSNLPVRSIVFFDLENNWEPRVLPWDELEVQALYEPSTEGLSWTP